MGQNLSLVQALVSQSPLAALALFFVYLFLTDKLHTDREYKRLLKENEALKKALDTEREAANEAARTGGITNRLIGALVEVSAEREHRQLPQGKVVPDNDPAPGDLGL